MNKSILIKSEFESYIYTEKQLNKAINNYQCFIDFDTEQAEIYENRVNILTAKLDKQVKLACLAFHTSPEQFITDLNEFILKEVKE